MKKFLFITITVLAILALAVFIYLKNRKLADFEPAIKDKLQALIIKATDSLYRLEFDTLDADIINSKLTVVNARLIPDSAIAAQLEAAGTRPEDIFNIRIDTLAVAGINFGDFTSNKKIDLDTLYINEPHFEVFHKKPASAPKDTTTIKGLYEKLAKQLNRLSIKKLYIKDMHMVHHNYRKGEKEKKIMLDNINIAFDDILMDSTTAHDTTRFMFAKDAVVTMAKLKLPTGDSLYYIKLDSLFLNAVKNTASLIHFSLDARYTKESYVNKVPFSKDLYNIDINRIILGNINWGQVLTGESFSADKITATGGSVKIYCDRRLPRPPSKIGRYPHQLLMKSTTPIRIKEFVIDGFNVSYEEFNPNSGQAGKLIFNNTNGRVTNITNDKAAIAGAPYMKAVASAALMNVGKINATFLFNLAKAKEGVFSVDANMGEMSTAPLNKTAEALGRFSIEKGNIHSLTVHVQGNNHGAYGNVKFLYDDLKINVLKKDDNDTTKLKKRGLISFIANTFVIKNANPTKGLGARTEQASFTRDPSKSFFNLVWKTIEDGIKKTAGYNKK